VRATIRRGDPRRDMVYHVRLVDAAGNVTIDSGVVAGFTLAVLDRANDTAAVRLNRNLPGDSLGGFRSRCDSVSIANYGSQPLHIADVMLKGNLAYSIPPAQLPLDIEPGTIRRMAICLEGTDPRDEIDTLLFFDGCGTVEEVELKTAVDYVYGLGADRCGNALGIQNYGPTRRSFMTPPVPNPATSVSAFVDVGLARAEVVSLEVFDMHGNAALTVLRGISLDAGINRVLFDVSGLESGAYFCRMITGSGEAFVEKMVVDRGN
jgi:hypothetical protein